MFLNSIYNPGNYVDLRCCPCHNFNCNNCFPNPSPCDYFPNPSPCYHDNFVINIPKCTVWFMAGFMLNNFKR